MDYQPETPFDGIESSLEYVTLLTEAIEETRRDVEAEIALAEADEAERRKQALLVVSYSLEKLTWHMAASRRILNDLRTLHRLLVAGLPATKPRAEAAQAGSR
jgi:hypothetical protein